MWLHRWGLNLARRGDLRSPPCNVSPLLGEKPQNRPLSKLNTERLALRAMLPVNTEMLRSLVGSEMCIRDRPMRVKFGIEEGTKGPLLPAKFHPHRCNVSPLRGEKPQNRPLSKLNTGRLALRAMLPVIKLFLRISYPSHCRRSTVLK